MSEIAVAEYESEHLSKFLKDFTHNLKKMCLCISFKYQLPALAICYQEFTKI